MLTPIGTRQLMPQTSAERGGVSGAWLRQKYKPTLKHSRWVYTFDAVKRFDAFSYASLKACESVLRRICLYFSRRHQRASTRARKRSSAQDATKFNGAELSRFTPANESNSANHVPVSQIKFAADGSCNYVREIALVNQLVRRTWSRPKCSRDPADQTEFFIPASLL